MRRTPLILIKVMTLTFTSLSPALAWAGREQVATARDHVCAYDLRKEYYLTNDQIRAAIFALEKRGLKISLRLFKYRNAELDACISEAIGTRIDMNILYASLVRKGHVSVARIADTLLGRETQLRARKQRSSEEATAYLQTPAQPVAAPNIPDNAGELITHRLREMISKGLKPNSFTLSNQPYGQDLLFLINETYAGSLFLAVKAAGLNVQEVFQKTPGDSTTFYTPKDILLVVSDLKDSKSGRQILENLPSIAAEFPPDEAGVAASILTEIVALPASATEISPVVLTDLCSKRLRRKIEIGQVARTLRILATNRSLLEYLKI